MAQSPALMFSLNVSTRLALFVWAIGSESGYCGEPPGKLQHAMPLFAAMSLLPRLHTLRRRRSALVPEPAGIVQTIGVVTSMPVQPFFSPDSNIWQPFFPLPRQYES